MHWHPAVNVVELTFGLLPMNKGPVAGMEPAGAERHRRSRKGELDGGRANQSNRNVEENPVVHQNPV